jgi:hypothetical protein
MMCDKCRKPITNLESIGRVIRNDKVRTILCYQCLHGQPKKVKPVVLPVNTDKDPLYDRPVKVVD